MPILHLVKLHAQIAFAAKAKVNDQRVARIKREKETTPVSHMSGMFPDSSHIYIQEKRKTSRKRWNLRRPLSFQSHLNRGAGNEDPSRAIRMTIRLTETVELERRKNSGKYAFQRSSRLHELSSGEADYSKIAAACLETMECWPNVYISKWGQFFQVVGSDIYSFVFTQL